MNKTVERTRHPVTVNSHRGRGLQRPSNVEINNGWYLGICSGCTVTVAAVIHQHQRPRPSSSFPHVTSRQLWGAAWVRTLLSCTSRAGRFEGLCAVHLAVSSAGLESCRGHTGQNHRRASVTCPCAALLSNLGHTRAQSQPRAGRPDSSTYENPICTTTSGHVARSVYRFNDLLRDRWIRE